MALHTKKEFAAMCGMDTKKLSVYAGRKPVKVVYSGEYVDDSIEPNKSFLKKRQSIMADAPKLVAKKDPKIVENQPEVPDISAPNFEKPDKPNVKSPKRDTTGTLYEEKTEAEIEKIKVDTRLKLLQEKQKKGQSMPTDAAKVMIAQLGKAFITKFQVAADNFLMEIAKTKDLSRTEVALMRNRLAEIINDSSSESVEEAKRYMRAVIKEISIKRGVGEHD